MQRLAHFFKHQTFMRRMLINYHQSVVGLCNNVIFVNLRAGCTEWVLRAR